MKHRFFLLIAVLVLSALPVTAQRAPDLTGVFDSTVNFTAGAGEAPGHSWGIEEYANLRLRVRGERVTFFGAFNLIASAGNFLETAAYSSMLNNASNPYLGSTPFVSGENYAAALELERLYMRINSELFDIEAGLLRMGFGYGQVWGSSDFLNMRNPLSYNARPRGVLGANVSFYPMDSMKLLAFAASPLNPLELANRGGGIIPGISMDQHWDRASLQALYAFQTPFAGTKPGIHRFGLSLKADLELGFAADALYTLDPDDTQGIEGLSVGAGFDYSFLGGDLFVLAEYLFNGSASATALGSGGVLSNHHYLSAMALYRFNDYCSLGLSTIFCFDDLSFSPSVLLEYEVFQGLSLNLSIRVPLDQETIADGKPGELGPIPPLPDGEAGQRGARLIINAGAKLRF